MTPEAPSRRPAFTLVEVLIVVAVIGIIGGIVVPQMLNAGTLGVQAASRMIVADILYAQNDAVAHQSARRVVFDPTGNGYSVTDGSGTALTAPWRKGAVNNYTIDFDTDSRFRGVTLAAADFGGSPTLEFADDGGVVTGGTVDIAFNDRQYRVSVAPFTGRVTVDRITGGT